MARPRSAAAEQRIAQLQRNLQLIARSTSTSTNPRLDTFRDKSFYQAKKNKPKSRSPDSKKEITADSRDFSSLPTSWQSRRTTVRALQRSTVTPIQPTGSKKRNCGINNEKIRRETTLLILFRLRPSQASVSHRYTLNPKNFHFFKKFFNKKMQKIIKKAKISPFLRKNIQNLISGRQTLKPFLTLRNFHSGLKNKEEATTLALSVRG